VNTKDSYQGFDRLSLTTTNQKLQTHPSVNHQPSTVNHLPMPGNTRAIRKRISADNQFFVHPRVAATYQLAHEQQSDTLLRIPALQWRGMLSRITPAVAEHLVANGSHLIKRLSP
jgi:hypothetical protein